VTIELIAGSYGVAMSLAPLLQAHKMKRRHSSADFSLPYMTVLLIGFAIYLVHGISANHLHTSPRQR
jgi:MtN3 and saliva related transmembrane protein